MTDVSQHGCQTRPIAQPSPSTRGGRPTITQAEGELRPRQPRSFNEWASYAVAVRKTNNRYPTSGTSGSGSWSSFMPIAHETPQLGGGSPGKWRQFSHECYAPSCGGLVGDRHEGAPTPTPRGALVGSGCLSSATATA